MILLAVIMFLLSLFFMNKALKTERLGWAGLQAAFAIYWLAMIIAAFTNTGE